VRGDGQPARCGDDRGGGHSTVGERDVQRGFSVAVAMLEGTSIGVLADDASRRGATARPTELERISSLQVGRVACAGEHRRDQRRIRRSETTAHTVLELQAAANARVAARTAQQRRDQLVAASVAEQQFSTAHVAPVVGDQRAALLGVAAALRRLSRGRGGTSDAGQRSGMRGQQSAHRVRARQHILHQNAAHTQQEQSQHTDGQQHGQQLLAVLAHKAVRERKTRVRRLLTRLDEARRR